MTPPRFRVTVTPKEREEEHTRTKQRKQFHTISIYVAPMLQCIA